MHIKQLSAEQFRNFRQLTVELHPTLNIIWGNNAQGKTNLLEAAYYCVLRQSFRQAKSKELICIGQDHAALRAEIEVDGLTREVRVAFTERGRQVQLDGKAARSSAQAFRGFSAVVFCPEDLRIPRGAPSERRRLLDDAITAVWPAYLELQRDYAKVVASRNRCLKLQLTGLDAHLDVYDQQLVRYGALIVAARRRYIARLEPLYRESYRAIVPRADDVRLEYHSAHLDPAVSDAKALEAPLAEALARARGEDIARRLTSVGPHTDDLSFFVDGMELRRFGSQGQLRTAVLSFKISQISDIEAVIGHQPILLLDDVSSELDAERNEYLFEVLKEKRCQLLVSTARPQLLELGEKKKTFQIVNGNLCA